MEHAMHPDTIEMQACVNDFLKEMEAGLAGETSSLRMIPTYIQLGGDLPLERPVIVIDAGGTHFRVASASIDRTKGLQIQDKRQYPMPGTEGPLGKRAFFETMACYLDPLLDRSEAIGFVFSYPSEILPNRDGRLIRFCKEVQAPELEGELIGAGLNDTLTRMGRPRKHIVILNDTVATLLAGRADSGGRHFDGFIGFILGTGSNSCYVERNARIETRPGLDPQGSQIVNIESGAFALAPAGTADRTLDRASAAPGQYTFEKMFSGAYFGPLVLLTAQLAADEGLLSPAMRDRLGVLETLSSESVNDLLQGQAADPESALLTGATGSDRARLLHIIRRLIQRAAKLTAANLAAVILRTGGGTSLSRPICITAEGTTFFKLQGLRSLVGVYLDDFLQGPRQRYYEIRAVEEATLLGAAVAAWQNGP